jgi:hypothetical protein
MKRGTLAEIQASITQRWRSRSPGAMVLMTISWLRKAAARDSGLNSEVWWTISCGESIDGRNGFWLGYVRRVMLYDLTDRAWRME